MSTDIQKIAVELGAVISGGGGDVLVDIFNRVAYSTDASIYQIVPLCVVQPRNATDVAAIVKYAAANNIPLAGRGAGSGLAGEALTCGIVIDFTRHMNSILEVAPDGSSVTCQPGVVLDTLNARLAEYGTRIGPDPSSGNRAAIGGVVANNATGAHSLQYGYIAAHVEAVEVVLADSSIVEFTNGHDLDVPGAMDIAKKVYDLLEENADVISNAQPETKRNRCGYNISDICDDNNNIDMAKLMAGSEGTLGLFTKIRLSTVAVPKYKALLQIDFDSYVDMAQAVVIAVDSGAVACELVDKNLIKMTLDAYPEYCDIFPNECVAQLIVEFTADSAEQVREKIDKCNLAIGILAIRRNVIFDVEMQGRIFKSRKDAVPLMNREKGRMHPIAFIEDISVPYAKLAEYVIGIEKLGPKYDLALTCYGHAGDGELHIRPYLDLYDPADVQKMRQITNDVFELAWSLGGTISGEHADGLLRAAFIEKQYGKEYYAVLRKVKEIFDPAGIMNPGKIINDDPDVMIKNLRAANLVLSERLDTNLLFSPDEFRFEIEQCNGDGVCISTQPGSRMCPVFRATGDELACSRGKANLLRAWITGLLEKGDLESPEFKKILSLCVNCKMCSVECPSGVDISKLIIEARAEYVKHKGLTRTEFILTHNRFLSILGSAFAPLSSFAMSLRPFKWLLEKTTGIDRRRAMPAFEHGSFLKKGRAYLDAQPPLKNPVDKVAYFVDSYAAYNDHELGFAVIKTLLHNNIEVVIPPQRPAPLPAIVYGDMKTAKKDLAYNIASLTDVIDKRYKIVCSEPSAALCLKDDLRFFIDSDAGRTVSANTYELMSYLNSLNASGLLKTSADAETRSFAYHSPCHMCAMGLAGNSIELLNKLACAKITDVGAGCCGLAGTCGMQKKNYDLSVKIGNEMVDAIDAMDTEYALTECAACKMQIEQLTSKKVIHPIKILANAYGLI